MKQKVIVITTAVLLLASIVSVVFYSIERSENNNLSKELDNTSAYLDEAIEKNKIKNAGLESTADEIKVLQRKIEEQDFTSDKTISTLRQNVIDYINLMYNSEGTAAQIKSSILKNVGKYAEPGFIKSSVESRLGTGSGNGNKKEQKKAIANFCTEKDVYINLSEYYDGSNGFIIIAQLNYGNRTAFRLLTATSYSGKVLINSDEDISKTRIVN